jgi:hypothetical protein
MQHGAFQDSEWFAPSVAMRVSPAVHQIGDHLIGPVLWVVVRW